MILIIAGGRDYQFTDNDYAALNQLHEAHSIKEVVSGGATGADRCGEVWADSVGIAVRRFAANWNEFGKGAGPMRNREMAKYADAVALFKGGRGTASMRKEAEKAGIKIYNFIDS